MKCNSLRNHHKLNETNIFIPFTVNNISLYFFFCFSFAVMIVMYLYHLFRHKSFHLHRKVKKKNDFFLSVIVCLRIIFFYESYSSIFDVKSSRYRFIFFFLLLMFHFYDNAFGHLVSFHLFFLLQLCFSFFLCQRIKLQTNEAREFLFAILKLCHFTLTATKLTFFFFFVSHVFI